MSNDICVQYICNIKGSSLFYFFYFLTYYIYLKNPSFSNKKPFSKIAKGLEIVWLPLLDTFRTFCWGEIIEELRKIYKLKELIKVPVSVPNNV